MKRASFLQTKSGQVLSVPVLLLLAYVAGSLAIDRGNLGLYATTLLLVCLAIRQLILVVSRK